MTNKPGTVAATTCPKILIKFVVDCIEAMCRQNSCLHNFFLFLFFKVKERERDRNGICYAIPYTGYVIAFICCASFLI